MICQVTQDDVQTSDENWSTPTATQSVRPVVIPGADGFIFTPVKAYIDTSLWRILSSGFLDSAIVNSHETEALLEAIDASHNIQMMN